VNRITASASVKWDITKDLYIKATGSAYLFENLDVPRDMPEAEAGDCTGCVPYVLTSNCVVGRAKF
jgi:hypothetical protein